jgi:hypothetical protein
MACVGVYRKFPLRTRRSGVRISQAAQSVPLIIADCPCFVRVLSLHPILSTLTWPGIFGQWLLHFGLCRAPLVQRTKQQVSGGNFGFVTEPFYHSLQLLAGVCGHERFHYLSVTGIIIPESLARAGVFPARRCGVLRAWI